MQFCHLDDDGSPRPEIYQYGPRDFGYSKEHTQAWIGDECQTYGVNIRFSDLVLNVGPREDKFYLHSAIVLHQSELLWGLRNYLKDDDIDDYLHFRYTKPSTMMTVIRFLYTGEYDILGFEVDHEYKINDEESIPLAKSVTAGDKVILDYEAAALFEISYMQDAIVNAVLEDLEKLPNRNGHFLPDEPIRFLCEFFSTEEAQKDSYYHDFAAAVCNYCDPEYIETALENPDGIDDYGEFLDFLWYQWYESGNDQEPTTTKPVEEETKPEAPRSPTSDEWSSEEDEELETETD